MWPRFHIRHDQIDLLRIDVRYGAAGKPGLYHHEKEKPMRQKWTEAREMDGGRFGTLVDGGDLALANIARRLGSRLDN